MDSQLVYCPNCKAQIPADDINIKALVGKCVRCNHVFPLPIASAGAAAEAEPAPSRPSGIAHETGANGEMYIRRRWFHPTLIVLLFFCIAWDGFLVFWYSMVLFGPVQNGGGFEWIAVLFPICHVAIGVGLTYYVVAGFLNTTRILVDDDMLYIRHRPIPWYGNRDLLTAEIQGIELDMVYTNNSNNGGGQRHFAISAHHLDSRQVVLISGLEHKQAHYIAYHLASHLGVPLTRDETDAAAISWPRWLRRRSTR